MTKKQHTLYSIAILIVGFIGGVAGTAFSMGAEKQRINDTLLRHTTEIATLVASEKSNEKVTQQKLDHFTETIVNQIDRLKINIAELATIAGNLRTDVAVLKTLMDRVNSDLKSKNSSG